MVLFQDAKSKYELVKEYVLNCTPHVTLVKALQTDFKAMASMFFADSEVPTFDEALSTLGEIDAMVADWKTSADSPS